MKSVLIFGASLLLSASCLHLVAYAQAPPPAPKKAETGVQSVQIIPFSLSASGGGTGDYLPSSADTDPQTKHYYIALTASITVPDTVPESALPQKIRIVARRVRNEMTPVGVNLRIYMDEHLDLPPLQRFSSMPGPQNTRTYSYSRYDISFHNNAKEYEDARIAGDWDVSKVLGRWELRVHPEDGLSNPVEIKIDKRAQLVNYGRDWVSFWSNRPASSYDPDPVKKSVFHSNGQDVFVDCVSFVQHIYDHHGLTGARTAPDSGAGSVRTFIGHFGLISGSGTIINNNNPQYTQMTTLQSVLEQLFGIGYQPPPYWGVTEDSVNFEPPVATTGPSDLTVSDERATTTPPTSLLKSLDDE